ncbi:MAG TPA: endonuclease V [Saprospiraceae bacterium]|nr:endonuclease V [Saprospiraceae bacterium]
MILAIDVHYKETYAKAVGVLFNWQDEHPQTVITAIINEVEEYQSGQFFKRELPCILELIKQVDITSIEAIIIDGHVYVDNQKKYGLGAHLWSVLNGVVPIIGVAKKSFIRTNEVCHPVCRGESKQALYVSVIGDIDMNNAVQHIRLMKGEFRIPKMLKYLDQLTKEV